ncbi:MAG: SDR family NAD(P)-dependent oxidoreductase, partial [Candidatus Parabeggiatoa sp.]|nr:SDR family NAD(P)-dependent oxidoreductase [Candidatus Parabeggiatoa sp.]
MFSTPLIHTLTSQAGMLSPTGKCRTFDSRADGMALGEGVGVVVLKPLELALKAGDHIYGVIKGSGINQDGKTHSGITVPSASAQTELECEVYSQCNIHPETISYVEAHGTGTPLGDPIEIEALTKAFRKYTHQKQYCAIGSVKTNIGHTQIAAGIAGLIKLLLCLKHKTLVPSLHLEKENEHINFKESPFYVNTQLKEWKTAHDMPRRAAISAFGMSGTNAHLVIEEYESPECSVLPSKIPQLLVLSAKNEERLLAYAQEIRDFLTSKRATNVVEQPGKVAEYPESRWQIQQDLLKLSSEILTIGVNEIDLDVAFSEYSFDTVSLSELSARLNDKYQVSITLSILSGLESLAAVAQYLYDNSQAGESIALRNSEANFSLTELAYTLQVGRDAMVERLAMVVESFEEAKHKLTQYVQGQTEIEGFYQSNIKANKVQSSDMLIAGEAGEAFMRVVINNKDFSKLGQLWVSGVEIDWQLLYPNQKPQRVSLPTYPFARERYWIPTSESKHQTVEKHSQITKLHPLLDSNTSTLKEQKFTTQLTGEEFYLTDHVVGEQKTLPGGAILEMARVAGELAGEQPVKRITNIVWAELLTVSDTSKGVDISLYPTSNEVEFEVTSLDDNGSRQVHAQGQLIYESQLVSESERIDIEAIKNRCPTIWSNTECYQLFNATNQHYGPGFQTIQTLYHNDSEALSRLLVPNLLKEGFNDFVLHPSLMEGALQTVSVLMGQNTIPYVPSTLGEVEVLGPLSEQSYAYVLKAKDPHLKFNILMLDEMGEVRVRLSEFSVKPLTQQPANTPVKMYYENVWQPSKTGLPTTSVPIDLAQGASATGLVLLFDLDKTRYPVFKERLLNEVILVMPGESYQALDSQTYSINPNHPADYRQLLAKTGLPSHIIHLWSQTPFDEGVLNTQLEMGLYSCFHLSQTLLEQAPVKPIFVSYIYLDSFEARQPQYAAFQGFAKTIRLENPNLNYQTIALSRLDKVVDIVLSEFQTSDIEVCYDNKGQRWVKHLKEFDGTLETRTTTLLKENGVYLITGGAGGLGLIFAEYLAKHFKAKLVLSGRSALNEAQTHKIQQLNDLGAQVIYQQADISNREEVVNLIAQTKSRFNEINGIIHSAGVAPQASSILKKTPAEIAAVLAPKVHGTLYLDEASQEEPLDFFVLFSSFAAVIGIVGRMLSEYAYANSFMDNFALWREEQRATQKRFGKTLSINWPSWQSGGMHVDEQTEKWIINTMGIQVLSTEMGLEVFNQGLTWPDKNQFLFIEGFRPKVKKWLALELESADILKPTETIVSLDSTAKSQLLEKVQAGLVNIAATILKLNPDQIDLSDHISEYGFNSIAFTQFADRINEKYQLEITPAIFFEYPSMGALSQFMFDKYQQRFLDYYQNKIVSTTLPTTETTVQLKSR